MIELTFRFIFTDGNGEPTEPIMQDGRNLGEPITVQGMTAADVNAQIELQIEALQVDMKAYDVENEDYMGNEGSYGYQGLVHTDTEFLSGIGTTPQEVGFYA